MSLQTVLGTIETTLENGVKWVEGETDIAVTDIWDTASTLFTKFEPTLVQGAIAAVKSFLTAQTATWGLDDIEQNFLEALEAEGSALFGQITGLTAASGSTLLQVLIGLVKDGIAAI